MKLIRIHIPLSLVKMICVIAVPIGLFLVVAGQWISGLCVLMGAYILEKSRYRCPHCQYKLNMKQPILKSSYCPSCGKPLYMDKPKMK
jgi:uncharacterized paraquat-inducible protein A